MSLVLRSLKIELMGQWLFAPLDLEIPPGQVVTIMGPSGVGKSTLLAAICGALGTEFSVSGEIRLKGRLLNNIPMEKRDIGLLLQDDLLFPHLSVGGNLAFALPTSIGKKERRAVVQDALAEAGMTGFYTRDPETLSGGQRARVSLLRSLLAKPKAILLDEPFSKLDQKLKAQIRSFVFERIHQMNIPALLVTHDPEDCPGGLMIDLEKL